MIQQNMGGGEVEEEEGGGGLGGGPKTTTTSWWQWWCNENTKACGAVVLIRLIYAGMYLVTKAAFDGGLNPFILVFYRQAFATVILAPLAYFLEWKRSPPLSLLTFCKIFVVSLIGITLTLITTAVGLVYTSASLAAAISNTVPIITFFLALLFRMETLKMRTRTGMSKLLGLVICLGGVAALAFYKGPHFKFFCLFKHLHGQSQYLRSSSQQHSSHDHDKSWVKGCLLMLFSNICWGMGLVFQAILMKSYPPKLMFTALQCFQSSIQSLAVAVAVKRDLDDWKLGWNIRLLAVTYSGVVVTAVTYYLQAWVLEKKGPVFLAMFTPLTFIFTMLCSALLCDFITLGSVLGAMLLAGGLYSVLWAKGKEERMMMKIEDEKKTIVPQMESGDSLELKQGQQPNIPGIVVQV